MGKQKYYSINNRVKRLYLFTLRPYTIPVLVLIVFLTGITLFNSSLTRKHALAASYTWDGGGSTNDWSECTNWSTDICPTSADTVTFNATSTKDSTVDASFGGVVTSVSINSGYTGTLSLSRSLQTTTSFAQAAGIFTAGSHVLDVDTTLSVTGGNFTASSTTIFLSALIISGSPTFNHNAGTIIVDTNTSSSLTCNNATFNLVQFVNTGGQKTVNSNCNLPLGNNPSIGPLTLNGTLSGTGTLSTTNSTLILNAGASLSGFTGLMAAGAVTVSGATLNFGAYTTFDINNTFTFSSGVVTMPSGIATFNGIFTISGGTFNANGGTVTFDGTTTATISCNSTTFNLIAFAHTAGIKTVSSDCTLPLGNNPTVASGSGALTLNGTLSGTGTLNVTGSLTFNASTATLSGFSGYSNGGTTTILNSANLNLGSYTSVTFNALTLGASAGTVTLPDGAFLNSLPGMSGGVLNAPSGTMTVNSTFNMTGGTFNANGGTVAFGGTNSVTLACNNATFNLVTFIHTAGTKTVSSNCTFPLGNNPTIGAGGLGQGLTLNGTLTGTGTLTTASTLTFTNNTGSSVTGFSGIVANSTYNIAGATVDQSTYTTADYNGAFQLTSGTFTAPTGTMTAASTFTLSSGTTFNASGGTLTFDGTTNATLTCNNATFNMVVFAHTGGTKTVGSNCSMPLGNNPTKTTVGGITLNGTLSGSGTLSLTVAGLNINSATATLAGFDGLVIGATLTHSLATTDLSSYVLVDILSFTLNSGTFIAPTDTMTIAGSVTVSGGTFNANGGTVTFDGTSSQNLSSSSCAFITFNKVIINKTDGDFTIDSGCVVPLGANPIINLDASESLQLSGTLSGTGSLSIGSSKLVLMSGYDITGFDSLTTGDLTVDGATANFGSYSLVDVNGNFKLIKPGVFTAPASGAFAVAGNFDSSSSEGHLRLPGSNTDYASSPDSAALSVTGDLDIRVRVALEDWITSIDQTLISKFDIDNSQMSYDLKVGNTTGVLGLHLSSNGSSQAVALSSAPLDIQNGASKWLRATYRVSDQRVQFFTSDDGIVWEQLGTDLTHSITSIYDSTTPLEIGKFTGGSINPANGKFYHAQIRNNILDDGTGIVFDADFTSHPDGTTSFTESSSNAATVTVNGSTAQIVSDGSGTFTPNNGTVLLDGSSQTISGALTFYNLTKTIASASTLTLPSSTTTTIQNNLTLTGAANQLLSLASSAPGTRWQLNVGGSHGLNYLYVVDSYNLGSLLTTCNSTDGGNNLNWLIKTGSCATTSSTTSRSGSAFITDDTATTDTPTTDTQTDTDTDRSPNSFFTDLKNKVTATEQSGWSYKKVIVYSILGLFLLWILILVIIKLLRRREEGYYNG